MYARQITSEQKYTLAEASRIIARERQEKREVLIQKLQQKLMGLVAVGISVASPLLLDGDATISVFMLPIGIYALLSRKNIFEEE